MILYDLTGSYCSQWKLVKKYLNSNIVLTSANQEITFALYITTMTVSNNQDTLKVSSSSFTSKQIKGLQLVLSVVFAFGTC